MRHLENALSQVRGDLLEKEGLVVRMREQVETTRRDREVRGIIVREVGYIWKGGGLRACMVVRMRELRREIGSGGTFIERGDMYNVHSLYDRVSGRRNLTMVTCNARYIFHDLATSSSSV